MSLTRNRSQLFKLQGDGSVAYQRQKNRRRDNVAGQKHDGLADRSLQ